MISCGIASIPIRVNCLKRTLDSIRTQVDLVFVTLNGYEYAPPYLEFMDNVSYTFSDNSLGDAMKFQMASHCSGYYLALDDDLEAEIGYVDKLIAGVEKYNGLISLHGKLYPAPVISYKQWHGNYRCLDEVKEDVQVNLIGSGCCAFKTSRLNVNLAEFKLPNMSDVWLSKIATEQNVPMVVLAHPKGEYLNYQHPPGSTIWQDTHDYSHHVEIMNKFIK